MLKSFVLVTLAVFSINVSAVRVQILHTNDTHAYLDKSTHEINRGGSARLKALMDYYEDRATNDGVKTFKVDAGDFSEGNMYYLAERARSVFNI